MQQNQPVGLHLRLNPVIVSRNSTAELWAADDLAPSNGAE
jgi:hypothetical protein